MFFCHQALSGQGGLSSSSDLSHQVNEEGPSGAIYLPLLVLHHNGSSTQKANGYSSDSAPQELSNEYRHYLVKMIFIMFCNFVHWMKVTSARAVIEIHFFSIRSLTFYFILFLKNCTNRIFSHVPHYFGG